MEVCGQVELAIRLIETVLVSMVRDGLITEQEKDRDIIILRKGLPSEILK